MLSGNFPLNEAVHMDVVLAVISTGVPTDATGDVTLEVFEEATDTPIISVTMTKRTSLTGHYRGTFTMSEANGFENGKFYIATVSATVSAAAQKHVIGNWRCVSGEAQVGLPLGDTWSWRGNVVPEASVNGVPEVDITHILGTASQGAVGYVGIDWGEIANPSSSVTLSATSTALVEIIGEAGITAMSFAADSGFRRLIDITLDSATSTTVTLPSLGGASAVDDFYKDCRLVVYSGTGSVQERDIVSYVGSTRVATVDRAFATTPDNTSNVVIFTKSGVNVAQAGGTTWGSGAITAGAIADGAIDAATFASDVDAEINSYILDDGFRIDGSALNTATVTTIPAILEDTGTTLQNEVDGIQADTEDIQSRLPAALTGAGNIKSDSLAIDGSTTAATNLKNSALAIISGTVQAAEASANSATAFDTDLTLENTGYYGNADGGLVLVFINTANNKFQARRVVNSATGTLNTRITVEEAFDATPTNGDTFILLGRITELS